MGDRQLRSCVIDPALALSSYGLPLVQQLKEVMEVWFVREFWHILDNAHFYSQQPDLITLKGIRTPEQECAALEETIGSLRAWERFRGETDLPRLNLFWLGDNLQESFLPQGSSQEIFWRWEAIARSLDARLNCSQRTDYVLPFAFRDAVALAASLGSAFILTRQLPTDVEQDLPPEICQTLVHCGISCQFLSVRDFGVARERNYWHQLLVHTGLAKLLWAGLRLSILQLLVLPLPEFNEVSHRLPEHLFPSDAEAAGNSTPHSSIWTSARGFWYLI
jgi:hypothetical protein